MAVDRISGWEIDAHKSELSKILRVVEPWEFMQLADKLRLSLISTDIALKNTLVRA